MPAKSISISSDFSQQILLLNTDSFSVYSHQKRTIPKTHYCKHFEAPSVSFHYFISILTFLSFCLSMAEMKDAHVVEIPVDEEHKQKQLCSSTMDMVSAIQHHPLMEISQSPGHLLLLKLWQREEDLYGRRIARKETRMDSIKREIFQLCCFFLLFHGFFLTLLFTSSLRSEQHVCKKWWIPSLVSVSTSLVFVFLVQIKLFRLWKVWKQLQREKNDNRALSRCIQELRMKGASFDLSKEPLGGGKRMKSSSVEIKWKPLTWCSQYLITICLVCFAGLFFPASKLILCWL